MVEDGYPAFQTMKIDQLRDMFKVESIDEDGEVENGIDGGGLFKEFLLEMTRKAFAPGFGKD